MKHRRNKVKREHGIIENALPWLESLSRISEVTDIIPGVIEVSRSPERGIVYKYKTQTGCKILLKSNGSIQEAFVVTKYPERVKEWVLHQFPTVEADDKPAKIMKPKMKQESEPEKRGKEHQPLSRGHASGKRSSKGRQRDKQSEKTLKMSLGDQDPLSFADHLEHATLKALKNLKQSLEEDKRKTKMPTRMQDVIDKKTRY